MIGILLNFPDDLGTKYFKGLLLQFSILNENKRFSKSEIPGIYQRTVQCLQIFQWLASMPIELEGYIRPGCIILTIFVAMPKFMWGKVNDLEMLYL